MDLTIVASFSAAGLSFVSVLLGLRSQRQGGTEQWRRDVERPLVAEIFELSHVCTAKWMDAALARKRWLETDPGGPRDGSKGEAWDKNVTAVTEAYAEYRNLRRKIAELDLVSSREVRAAAHRFEDAHMSFAIAMNTAGGNTRPVEAHEGIESRVSVVRGEMVAAVRKDIGVDRGLPRVAIK